MIESIYLSEDSYGLFAQQISIHVTDHALGKKYERVIPILGRGRDGF